MYLQAALDVDLIVKCLDGECIPAGVVLRREHAVAEVVLHGAEGHEALHAAHRAGRAVHHLHVLFTAKCVDRLTIFLPGAAPTS